MVTPDPVPVGEAAVALASPQVALGSLAALGLLGVTDWILGDDEPPESTEEPAGGSGLFEDAETAGDGGVAGGADGDDEFAFEDDADDGFGDFDVDGMDEAEDGAGGTQVRELERRVEEMEDELSGISSTVSTVRTENEQISESVDDIEENVRKLLDIYKMVTKGVNPFVDEDGGGGGLGGEGSSLGLFDKEDDEQDADQLDEDVTDADAEEFFDDDFEEDETFDDGPDDEETDQTMAQSDDAPDEEGGAKSFDELREEYEDGAEWSEEDEDDAAAEADPEADDGVDEAESEEAGEDMTDSDEGADVDTAEDEGVDDERVDALFEEDAATEDAAAGMDAGAHQPAPGPAAARASRSPPGTGARQPVASGASGEKPYLRELPSGYVSDLLVMEWVEFLVTESSPAGAHRAITYYENVGWIGHRAADQLREFVDGHPEASAGAEEGDAALTMDHHTTSLRYVARITGDVQENVLASWDDGDNRWLQR